MRLSIRSSALVCALLLSACASSGGPTYQRGEKVFIYNPDSLVSATYDLSKEAYNINVMIENLNGVKEVSLGREKATSKEYGFKDGILTISGEFLKKVASGEKEISITPKEGRKINVPILVCDKLISTPQEFQDINEGTDGIYALANDIDFKDFGNFEPLGRYVTETDTSNAYFHGILEGNGFALKNMQVYYSMNPTKVEDGITYDTNEDNYLGTFGFNDVDAHRAGNNVGVFNFIGSSGVVRNLVFDNVHVRGRAIAGIIAGNCSGRVENVLIRENCSAKANAHFYDNNCNVGAAFGIVAGSASVTNVVSLTTNVKISDYYIDYNDEYSLPENDAKGNGWDHVPNSFSPTWKYAAANRENEVDSNDAATNGVYSVVGKSWGTVKNSIGASFRVSPVNGDQRNVNFGQTHLARNDNGSSGDTDMGQFMDCRVLSITDLKKASNYNDFDTSIWNIKDGSYPSLVSPQIKTGTIQ